MYGNQVQIPVPDVDRTDYFLMLGANPLVSNGSVMTAPDIEGRLRKLRARGGKLVVLDPRRTETAAVADEHHFIRPGTDALFLAALLNVLSARRPRAAGRAAAATSTAGTTLLELFAPYTPDRVARATGIPADDDRASRARARRRADRGLLRPHGHERAGVRHARDAGSPTSSTSRPAISIGRAAGCSRRPPSICPALRACSASAGTFDRWRSRVSGYPEFTGEFPVAALAEEIDTPGAGQVRGSS